MTVAILAQAISSRREFVVAESPSMADFLSTVVGHTDSSIVCEFALLADVVQLHSACQAMRIACGIAVRPHSIALGFASTRPCGGGRPLRLRQWSDVGEACVVAVESQGIPASAWGHAVEFTQSVIYSTFLEVAVKVLRTDLLLSLIHI